MPLAISRLTCFFLAAVLWVAGAAVAGTQCPDDDSGLTLPAGFCATVFADEIGHARQLVVSPAGVVYVNTWSGRYYGNKPTHEGGFVVALQDTRGTGKANVNERFGETVQTGGAGGTGIGLYRGSLYVEINDKIVRYRLAASSPIPSGPPETIVSGLPLGGDHPMHPFAIDPSGAMYVDVATATNSCQLKNRTLKSPGADPCLELQTRGGIWRFDANKTGQMFSPDQRYATGIRNAEGFAVDSVAHRIFVTQHGRDQLHANWPDLYPPEQEATLPAEELLLLAKGADYGWPECYYDAGQKKLVLAPEYGGDGGKAVGACADKTGAVAAFPAHWAPNGMVFYDGKNFPAHYRNGVFIAFHGSWDRAPYAQQGYNIVFQSLAGDKASGMCEIFADGFAGALKALGKADHQPSGVAVGPDGVLYVSDDVSGRIYRITYRGNGAAGAQVTPCPDAAAGAGPISALNAKPPEGTNPDAGAALPVPPGATKDMVELGNRLYHGDVGGATCTGCHGADGAGTPLGPDLTDQQWLWSDGSVAGIAKTIAAGVMQPKQYRAPMLPMGGAQLSADQVSALAAYVWGLSHRPPAPSVHGVGHPAELTIPGEKIYPESLTSTADGRIIIGSIGARTIFVVKPGSAIAEPWIQPDDDVSLGIFGVLADEKSGTLWACYSPAAHTPPQAKSALKAFDLRTGEFKAKYVLPTQGAFCNDIAVGSDGTAYATDSNNMEIVSVKRGGEALRVWAGDGELGPKGGLLDGIAVLGNRVIVNTLITGKLLSVALSPDGNSGAVAEVAVVRPLDRPDGMRSSGPNQLLLVEGGGAGRLSRVTFAGNAAAVTTIKEGFPDGPVSVAVLGTTAYVLEGQLAKLFGRADSMTGPKPFRATAVDISQ